jgi:hypothetical protein
MNGYTTIAGQDQNGQTIKQYTNNQSQCKSDCDSTNNCNGMVINGSNCWTIKSFPSPYNKSGSTTYKKNPPTVNFDGYTKITGQDQNGETIKQYTNNQQQCNADCNSNTNCKGMVINGTNCWTIKSFPSQYSNAGSAIYKKITYSIPAVTSSNFPTSENNNLFSSVFCKNISTNNGFIQKANSEFNNLPIYKTESTPNEDTCLNNCNADKYCSSYNFIKNNSSSNCLLYNQVPTSIVNNNNNNCGYKNNYKYNFDNLNSSQKNIVRNDCINNYLNENYDTNNLNYTSCYKMENNDTEINFDAQCLANMYEPLDKIKIINDYTNIDTDIINSTTNDELNNFANNYQHGYFPSQIALLNKTNSKHGKDIYNDEIHDKTKIEVNRAKNFLLEEKNKVSKKINDYLGVTEKFENNNDINNDINNDNNNKLNMFKSNVINFYLYIIVVIIFLYILYYLKKYKYFK